MKYNKLPVQLFQSHRQKLAEMMEDDAVLLLFSNDIMPRSGDQNYPYCQQADMFYLTGIEQPETVLMLCPQHSNAQLREVLFIQQPQASQQLWSGDMLTISQAQELSGISQVRYLGDMHLLIREAILAMDKIYFDIPENVRQTPVVEDANMRNAKYYKSLYPLHQMLRLAPLTQYLRVRKSEEEISLISKACDITAEAYMDLLLCVKPNVQECVLEGEIIKGFLARRATGCSFAPIVAAGKNTCILHYTANHSECKSGDLLLEDMGAEYAHYAGDLSRTIPVNGKFNPRQKEVYTACERVFRYARTLYVPGMSINKIQRMVCIRMQQELINLGLFTEQDVHNESTPFECVHRYFMHGVAHFVGIDVHDVGSKDMSLDYGMVLSCEPGIYIPEENIGIRIETIMQVNDEPIDLMSQVPLSVDEIETYMNQSTTLK